MVDQRRSVEGQRLESAHRRARVQRDAETRRRCMAALVCSTGWAIARSIKRHAEESDGVVEIGRERHQVVWPLIAAGEVAPVVGARVPLIDADRSHELMGSPDAPGGKLLLVR